MGERGGLPETEIEGLRARVEINEYSEGFSKQKSYHSKGGGS
jgi:hypothetical protein